MLQASKLLSQLALYCRMRAIKFGDYRKLEKAAQSPLSAQLSLLDSILKSNACTELGKQLRFSEIRSYEDFKRIVPIHEYEDIRPYIEAELNGASAQICRDKPLLYAQTSGTTGSAKYVPILAETIESYRRAQRIFSYAQNRDVPGIFSGKVLAIVSPAVEGRFSNDIPYGSMSGLVYESMPSSVFRQYVLAPQLFAIADHNTKYLLIAAFALAEPDITVLASANPSTFLKLAEIINRNAESLINFVQTGELDALNLELDSALARTLSARCQANEARATELREILLAEKRLRFKCLWPELKAVVTWTSGNCALLLPKLRKELSNDTKIIEMGYLSSEFRGTITIDCHDNLGLPAIQDVFFEFVEKSDWHEDNFRTLTIEALEQGKQYYVIVTCLHGLYRYFINDIVEVTGRYLNTPTVSFVQKGKGVTSLTGEKLYEAQVIQAFQQACERGGVSAEFFIMLADKESFSYRLYLEASPNSSINEFAMLFESALKELNLEYESKSASGRLGAFSAQLLREGTYESYRSFCLSSGQRESQFKVIKLQYQSDVQFPFAEHVL